ncbi:phosphoribosylglycinamide formyltransferase [Rhodoblastus acidophilus]|uniref:Phosphoribosylglycinamide formyltransferase n=1 Tax=Candidatus Rhodoblastus alkanivorans TaxID=2954117 RepID=A0ABS9Z8B5_9HYPH|nr:phosphoribosylglycinamide formyltransferase [Candidatus Rhodoblastus alkanivorans]MCI4683868.1 phosphoribosylglycinamide formyltransferase [Candidatus Rhodoblastus alkanivorans]MDI4641186.1 phosphoribosylglycinamide formyltransferase [Rhodoblastus acidophilus]
MTKNRKRVGVLISGRGSNMRALVEAARAPDFPAEIGVVLSNVPDVAGLDFARAEGITTAVVAHKSFPDRESFERAMHETLIGHGAELICLAGFMRILTPWFVSQWRDRMLNIHPALLPSYRGLHTHERALAEGVKIHGATVHFVAPEMDAGPIIVQAAVPVLRDDTPEALAARVLAQEHRIYPLALKLVASGAARVEGARVLVEGEPPAPDALLWPQ